MLCVLTVVFIIINIGLTSENTSNKAQKVVQVSVHTRINFPYQSWNMKRWRRAVSSDVSCVQSPIQTNMTLKGGIEAGYFRKLAQHVAMQLCIELCCEEKGCDVAFMSGKNCYGVQCFNEELCRALPAKKKVTEPVMISHVTFKGERVITKDRSPKKLQCSATRMKTGVTLRGGLKSGNFTDAGSVESMAMCVKLCCVSEGCDVALMINNYCFLVSCYNKSSCKMMESFTKDYAPSLSYVMRKQKLSRHNATSLQIVETTANQLVCKNSQVFYNTTMKGGYKAGNYTNFGKVANMSACVRLCCGNKDCDAALMLENNCFAVACWDSDNCLPVHAKPSNSLAALNPRISYITSRSEEVANRDQLTPDGTCHAGIISYDVSLRGGSNAGNFTPHGKVGNMETCIYKCCQIEGCGAAMMLKDTCFTVVCKNDELCEKKQTPTSSNFNPRIAYVFRDKTKVLSEKGLKARLEIVKHSSSKAKKKMLLAEQLHAITKSFVPTISYSSYTPLTSGDIENSTNVKTTPTKYQYFNTTMRIVTHNDTNRDIINRTGQKVNTDFSTVPSSINHWGGMRLLNDNSLKSKHTNYTKHNALQNVTNAEKAAFLLHFFESNRAGINENTTDEKLMRNYQPNSSVHVGNVTNECDFPTCANVKNDSQHDTINASELVGVSKSTSKLTSHESNHRNVNYNAANKVHNTVVHGLSSVDGDPGCTNSKILYNVTLRGGLHSGKFKDRGEMEDIKQCVKLCCLLDRCDLAFMLKRTCFSVECENELSCDAIPAKSAIFSPTICYVYVKTAVDIT